MYKYNSKIKCEGDSEKSIKQLRKEKKGLKRSRKTGFYYSSCIGEIDGVKVKVFLSRRGKRGSWHTIISTNTKLSFNQMVDIYNIRWSIEIFFKEAKQLLGLGGAQSTNFDVQVAQTTITMIQYLIISLKFRAQAYETMGGIFREMKQDFIELKLNDRIMAAVIQTLTILDELGATFNIEQVVSKLITYDETKESNQIYSNFAPL